MLPEKPAVAFAEGQQAAQIDIRLGPGQVAAAVVGADENLTAGHDRPAVGLAAQIGDPFDVAAGPRQPDARPAVELARRPVGGPFVPRATLFRPLQPAPLRPVAAAQVASQPVLADCFCAELRPDQLGRLLPQSGELRVAAAQAAAGQR